MKKTLLSLRRLLNSAYPLAHLCIGYLCGLALCRLLPTPAEQLRALPFAQAFPELLAAELPIFCLATLAGVSRLPALSAIPLFFRSILWAYGSLSLYLSVGQSALYFSYVIGVGITLIPLCCLTRLAAKTASASGRLSRAELIDYLCRALFYGGLTLMILLLRSAVGGS